MVINGGYYISERTSNEKPYAHIDSGTLYLPYDIDKNDAEEGGYKFEEYRVTIPITDDINADVLKQIVSQIPDVMDAINSSLKNIFGDKASINKEEIYKKVAVNIQNIVNQADLSDDESLSVIELHPKWEELCAENYTAKTSGYRI